MVTLQEHIFRHPGVRRDVYIPEAPNWVQWSPRVARLERRVSGAWCAATVRWRVWFIVDAEHKGYKEQHVKPLKIAFNSGERGGERKVEGEEREGKENRKERKERRGRENFSHNG